MERRSFLKFLLSTPLAAIVDYEKLLWIPEKTIFIPKFHALTESQIVAIELERITPKLKMLFERDATFFGVLENKGPVISTRNIRIPMQLEPGHIHIHWNKDA